MLTTWCKRSLGYLRTKFFYYSHHCKRGEFLFVDNGKKFGDVHAAEGVMGGQ